VIWANLSYGNPRKRAAFGGEIHKRRGLADIVLLQHDGFASRKQLDIALLERVIHEKTGYRMRLEENQIDIPPRPQQDKAIKPKRETAAKQGRD
jgi:hypothetical protein